ncbi:MAG: hypothetical protein Q8O37_01165 [Sulfuricellaceae bacterium]|nr:hypothetical protein [Sulfuricellaceae bacterium]
MSRHNITWKPQGAIPRDISMTIKMVKKPEEVKPEKKVIACESPPLMAVWFDPTVAYVTHVDVGDNSADPNSTDSPLVATLVNADWATAGLASPLCIDGSAVTWAVTFEQICIAYDELFTACGKEQHASVGLALGVTMGVLPSNQPRAGGNYGTLYATPSYKGVALNTITATIWLVL